MLNLVKKKELDLNLIKVKAHSNIQYNEKADILAKEALKFPTIEWKDLDSPKIITEIKWQDTVLDAPIRQFVKKTNTKIMTHQWTAQNRIDKKWGHQIQDQHRYTWDLVWEQMNNEHT